MKDNAVKFVAISFLAILLAVVALLFFSSKVTFGQVISPVTQWIYGTTGTSIHNRNLGNVGVGSTSPNSNLSIQTNYGDTNRYIFDVASSTGSNTSDLLTVNPYGVVQINSNVFNAVNGQGQGSLILNANDPHLTPVFVPHSGSIHIVGKDHDFAGLYIDSFNGDGLGNNGTLRSIINLRNTNGTEANYSATTIDEEMGRITGRGGRGQLVGTSIFTASCSGVAFMSGENFSATTNQGSYIVFKSVPLGSTCGGSLTSPPDVGKWHPSGGFSVGEDTFFGGGGGASNCSYEAGTTHNVECDPGHGWISTESGIEIGTSTPHHTATFMLTNLIDSGNNLVAPALLDTINAFTDNNNTGLVMMRHVLNLSPKFNTLYGDYADQFLGLSSTTPWGQLSINPTGLADGNPPAFVIGSSTATKFIVDDWGKVGIGTSSPYTQLSVVGSGYFSGSLRAGDDNSNGTHGHAYLSSDGSSLGLYDSVNDAYATLSVSDQLNINYNPVINNPYNGTIGLVVNTLSGQSVDLQDWNVNSVQKAAITKTGGLNLKDTLYLDNASTAGITMNDPIAPATRHITLNTDYFNLDTGLVIAAPAIGLNVKGGPSVDIAEFYDNSSNRAMTINSAGLVGIGTSSPFTKFSLTGTANNDPFVVASSTQQTVLGIDKNDRMIIKESGVAKLSGGTVTVTPGVPIDSKTIIMLSDQGGTVTNLGTVYVSATTTTTFTIGSTNVLDASMVGWEIIQHP